MAPRGEIPFAVFSTSVDPTMRSDRNKVWMNVSYITESWLKYLGTDGQALAHPHQRP